MREYMIAIIAVALLAAFAQIMSPKKWERYIKFITGLIIMNVIISPAFKLIDYDLFDNVQFETAQITDDGNKLILKELESKTSDAIKQKLMEELNIDYDVKTTLSVSNNYEVSGFNEVIICPDKKRADVIKILSRDYGLKTEKILFKNY